MKILSFTEREKKVMVLRQQGWTLEAIGKKYGVTRERIRQIFNKAKRKVKNWSFIDEELALYFTFGVMNMKIYYYLRYFKLKYRDKKVEKLVVNTKSAKESLHDIKEWYKAEYQFLSEIEDHKEILQFLVKQWATCSFADFPGEDDRPAGVEMRRTVVLYKKLGIVDRKKSVGHRLHVGREMENYLKFIERKVI